MKLLGEIKIRLPKNTFTDIDLFLSLFANTKHKGKTVLFPSTPNTYLPTVKVEFNKDVKVPDILFSSERSLIEKLSFTNETDGEWNSPHTYSQVALLDFVKRLENKSIKFEYYDHLGINLPWLNGFNPRLDEVLDRLAPASLLHVFPEVDDWFFIIPGTKEEIANKMRINYKKERRPKFEFVNFSKCSTPILQIDVATSTSFESLQKLFPEAIVDNDLRNIWVYLENETEIDICFVLNEVGKGWTSLFKGQRV